MINELKKEVVMKGRERGEKVEGEGERKGEGEGDREGEIFISYFGERGR